MDKARAVLASTRVIVPISTDEAILGTILGPLEQKRYGVLPESPVKDSKDD